MAASQSSLSRRRVAAIQSLSSALRADHHADATEAIPAAPPINTACVQLKPSSVPATGVTKRNETTSAPIDDARETADPSESLMAATDVAEP